ncbi:uncharacterized protein EI90DRAFT_3027208 [Cantharellus anzutake]|uniref:uncharacterized protein n=1 Tax=Cantharellus anzutake TaxID=1750568 RepID=UPI001908DAA2|nr:uncharacterized protein EI90DRAFT_3027208 [Cantharellus anzutake]KAF8343824.1 hypothetical protein EI90DRAFT_3027208 [Cantharellus anzutake]
MGVQHTRSDSATSREEVRAAIEAHYQPMVGPVRWPSGCYVGFPTPLTTFHPCLPTHYEVPKPLPRGVAVLPRIREQHVSHTRLPWPRVQPDSCLMPAAPHPVPMLPPLPTPLPPLPLPLPPPPHDGCPQPSHVVDYNRPRTRHLHVSPFLSI